VTTAAPPRRDSSAGSVTRELLSPPLGKRRVDLGRDVLSARLRPNAQLGILDITEFFGESSGGVRTYLMEKAAYVERREELRQIIVVPAGADAVTEVPGVRCYRMRGPRVPAQHCYRFMLAVRSSRRIVAHEHPDLIEVGSPGLVPWLMRHPAAAMGIPLVHFYHSDYPAQFRAGLTRWAALQYARAIDRMFAMTIVASHAVADTLRRAGIDRVTRIPLGVDSRCFHPKRRDHGMEIRSRLGIGEGPLVIFVGRFAREKALGLLLAAWPEIRSRTGASLLLVGDGPLRRSLLRALRHERHGRTVHWVPFTSDRVTLAALLASADLFISAGTAETYGLAALEALASGTPVLSADGGAVAEQVRESGSGALFRAGSPTLLAHEAVRLLHADRTEQRESARRYAATEHDWESVFDRIVQLHRSVANR
jgi:alpha-1,6-mannosyltransferase